MKERQIRHHVPSEEIAPLYLQSKDRELSHRSARMQFLDQLKVAQGEREVDQV
jgi:hypothetical protein